MLSQASSVSINLNYWRFGDYLGIGCGAHGKITFPDGRILRTAKNPPPARVYGRPLP
ncbi:radical SAM protein [Klebsiella pneumoniae]|uniref:Radical SAM protein n=1 Tax=Klebsiella pneumoniae TaxID=573 RepID=A0A378FS91_KLEPN|nr:radical SAM protein [Klebsiella pneumoniae]